MVIHRIDLRPDLRPGLTAERVRALLSYHPMRGTFRWRVRVGPNVGAGVRAGSFLSSGYRRIKINRHAHLEHRLAWLYTTGEWPAAEIDHIDGNPGHNKWRNLRAETRKENVANCRPRSARRAVNRLVRPNSPLMAIPATFDGWKASSRSLETAAVQD